MRTAVALAQLCLLLLCAARCLAQVPALEVHDAWVRAVPGQTVAAAYFSLHNRGTVAVTVRAVRSPLAGSALIHESQLLDGQARMRPRPAVSIAPGATVQFAPDALHVMLTQLTHPLAVGDVVPLVLELADGSTLSLAARVRPLAGD